MHLQQSRTAGAPLILGFMIPTGAAPALVAPHVDADTRETIDILLCDALRLAGRKRFAALECRRVDR